MDRDQPTPDFVLDARLQRVERSALSLALVLEAQAADRLVSELLARMKPDETRAFFDALVSKLLETMASVVKKGAQGREDFLGSVGEQALAQAVDRVNTQVASEFREQIAARTKELLATHVAAIGSTFADQALASIRRKY